MTWFIAVSVENNDYKLVDHKAYTSFIYLSPQYVGENEVKVVEKSNVYPTENISVLHRKLNQ